MNRSRYFSHDCDALQLKEKTKHHQKSNPNPDLTDLFETSELAVQYLLINRFSQIQYKIPGTSATDVEKEQRHTNSAPEICTVCDCSGRNGIYRRLETTTIRDRNKSSVNTSSKRHFVRPQNTVPQIGTQMAPLLVLQLALQLVLQLALQLVLRLAP
jgi:hypothetical protein